MSMTAFCLVNTQRLAGIEAGYALSMTAFGFGLYLVGFRKAQVLFLRLRRQSIPLLL